MGPSLDVYGLTRYRTGETINRFLDEFVDRELSEERIKELMIRKVSSPPSHGGMEDYEFEPVENLAHAIQRGLDYPARSFSIYLEPKDPQIEKIIIGFTIDNMVNLGLSIDDADESEANLQLARSLLKSIMDEFQCHLGVVVLEEPPPVDEQFFRELSQSRRNLNK